MATVHKTIWMPLGAILLAACVLLGAYNGLLNIRQARDEAELLTKMQTLLPGAADFTLEEYTGEDANIRAVYRSEKGYVVQTVTNGYAGPITMLVGVSNAGKVTGLQIRQMQETWGLGTQALTDWEFLAQFLGTAGNVAIATSGADAFSGATVTPNGEAETYVDGITGATVTSKAIARSVNSAVGFVTGADAVTTATKWGGQ